MSSKSSLSGESVPKVLRYQGFGLLELMVAMVLGLLLSAGILTVFISISTTNKAQDALSRLQENGRYAVTRISNDLRRLGAHYCNNSTSSNWKPGTTGNLPVFPTEAIVANFAGVSSTAPYAFPDCGGASAQLCGLAPTGLPAGSTYPVTSVVSARGYKCAPGGGCTPTAPTGAGTAGLPAEGTTNGTRVKGTDILTIRYQNGTGWPFTVDNTVTPATVTLAPGTGDDAINFVAGDVALETTCGGGQIFQVTTATTVLTPENLLNASAYKPSSKDGNFDIRIFNFSRDFNTVTYFLQNVTDTNPSAPAGRVIPTLMRRVNGGTADQIVQGVERLNFTFGFQYADGSLHFMAADSVSANSTATNCPAPASEQASYGYEPECLWRSLMTVQVNMLLDTIDNQNDLPLVDRAYHYSVDSATAALLPPSDPTAAMTTYANGQIAGSMMRREFISSVAIRNGNH